MGKQYTKPVLVIYTDRVESACGLADAAVGPFYCPGDSRVYIDLGFYRDMQRKLNAPGEFARAYVIAHEVGHHVQRLLGYSRRVDDSRARGNKAEINHMSVRLELQADFLAGVWAYHAQKKFNFLESGDIESALHAAFEIGDDRLQKNARGYVVPDSFTHGTSKQRSYWFLEGFKTGDVDEARALFERRYEGL
jgi:predicted metalloprotease